MKNEKALFALSYGLFVLTTRRGEEDNGCIINTAMQVTVTPDRVVFTVDKSNHTHDLLLASGVFTLSVLAEDAPFEVVRRFGFQSGRETDKFAGYGSRVLRGDNGTLTVTEGTNAWIAGKVVSATDLGTHTLFLADVTDADFLSAAPSATYAYYQARIKPKPPAAPAGKRRWVCRVCGYVYEGEELPADLICPVCKHPASDFEPLAGSGPL